MAFPQRRTTYEILNSLYSDEESGLIIARLDVRVQCKYSRRYWVAVLELLPLEKLYAILCLQFI